MKTLLICGALLVFTGPALVTGLITVDHHCRSDQTCVIYGALGRPLYLQLPDEYELKLFKIISGTFSVLILLFKNQTIRVNHPDPRWQFNTENRNMIISRAEKEDSGRYILETFSSDGKDAGVYDLQLIIEAVVSSVKVTDSCFSIEKRKVHCYSDGDQIQFSWTLNGIPHDQDLTDGNQTLLLDRSFTGSVSCHVKNHVSSGSDTVIIKDCSEPITAMMTTTEPPVSSPSALSRMWDIGLMVFVTVWLFEVIILVSLLVGAFYIYTRIYRKQRAAESKEQEGEEPL